jgi:hypothetical protein
MATIKKTPIHEPPARETHSADEILRAMVKKGQPEAELLMKRGRSRRLELSLGPE